MRDDRNDSRPSSGKPRGRRLGRPSGRKRLVSANIVAVFHRLGGRDALLEWARENPADFYTKLYVKLLPTQIQGTGPNGEHLLRAISDTPLTDDEWLKKFGNGIAHDDDSEGSLLESAAGPANGSDPLSH